LLDKVRDVRRRIDALGKPIRLQIDGGVTPETIVSLAEAGADTYVAGSAVFKHESYAAAIAALKAGAARAG
jgi:ribulose-phosphate 3-epimerase